MRIYYFNPGDYISESSEKLTHFYFYVQGKSKVFLNLENGKSLLCRFHHPPEIVGDVELFSGKTYNQSISNEIKPSYLYCYIVFNREGSPGMM